MENPKVVLLIFTSGKIVLAGAKTRKDVYTAYQKIYPVLFSFKKRNTIPNVSIDSKRTTVAGIK